MKIEEAGSTDEIPDNNPHVGCSFVIEFRGYDEGNLTATWTISGQPPSGRAEIASGSVFIGGDAAGGANDLDGTVTITLTDAMLAGLTEQPQQGFHLRLDVHAPGSKGSDQKHKVFWVQGCGADAGPPPTDAGADVTPPADAGEDAAVPPTDAAVPPTDAAVPPADAAVPPADAAVPEEDAGPKME